MLQVTHVRQSSLMKVINVNTKTKTRQPTVTTTTIWVVQNYGSNKGICYANFRTKLAVCARFAHQLVQATCLDFVQLILSDAITV